MGMTDDEHMALREHVKVEIETAEKELRDFKEHAQELSELAFKQFMLRMEQIDRWGLLLKDHNKLIMGLRGIIEEAENGYFGLDDLKDLVNDTEHGILQRSE